MNNNNLNKKNIIVQLNNIKKIKNIEKNVYEIKNNLYNNVKIIIKYYNIYIDIYIKLIEYNNNLNYIINKIKNNDFTLDIILENNELKLNEIQTNVDNYNIKFNYDKIDINNYINNDEKYILENISVKKKLENILENLKNIYILNNQINEFYNELNILLININKSYINIEILIKQHIEYNDKIYNKLNQFYIQINKTKNIFDNLIKK